MFRARFGNLIPTAQTDDFHSTLGSNVKPGNGLKLQWEEPTTMSAGMTDDILSPDIDATTDPPCLQVFAKSVLRGLWCAILDGAAMYGASFHGFRIPDVLTSGVVETQIQTTDRQVQAHPAKALQQPPINETDAMPLRVHNAADIVLLRSPRVTVQPEFRRMGEHLLRIAAYPIQSMRNAAARRTVADLGDHQLRDIGLWRVDCPRPLGRPQAGISVYQTSGGLGLF